MLINFEKNIVKVEQYKKLKLKMRPSISLFIKNNYLCTLK